MSEIKLIYISINIFEQRPPRGSRGALWCSSRLPPAGHGVPAGCLRQADFVGVSRKLRPLWNPQRFLMKIDILLWPKTSNFHHFGYIFCWSPPGSLFFCADRRQPKVFGQPLIPLKGKKPEMGFLLGQICSVSTHSVLSQCPFRFRDGTKMF